MASYNLTLTEKSRELPAKKSAVGFLTARWVDCGLVASVITIRTNVAVTRGICNWGSNICYRRVRYEAFRPEKKRAGTQGRSLGVCGALLLVSRLKETAFHASNKSASCSNAEVERSGRQTDPGTPIEALSCSRDSLIDRACGHTLKARIPCAGTFATPSKGCSSSAFGAPYYVQALR